MDDNVVVDGAVNTDRRTQPPSLLWLGMMLVIGAGSFALVSGGQEPVVPTPGTTLPDLVLEGEEWDLLRLPGSGSLLTVDATEAGGYLAAGEGPQFWRSPDGISWERGRYPEARPDVVAGIASSTDVAVAVGADTVDGTLSHAAAWWSEDGAVWHETPLDLAGPTGLDGVVEDNGRFVAWGWAGASEDYAPGVGPLLMVSEDGRGWHQISVTEGALRVRAVTRSQGNWMVMGGLNGQPALWSSNDLEEWQRVDTESLPFGWTMVDVYNDGTLLANLLDVGRTRTRRWSLGPDGWQGLDDPVVDGPVHLQRADSQLRGIGSDLLWSAQQGWNDVDLDGGLSAMTEGVIVGSVQGQPALWVEDATAPPRASSPVSPGPSWRLVANLGEGELTGPFQMADSWIVGVGDRWWLLGDEDPRLIDDLAGTQLTRIDRVGEEWVALPAMRWTDDGLTWVQRSDPWFGVIDGESVVWAASSMSDDSIRAVGATVDALWIAAETLDGGRTWEVVYGPAPTTPVYDVRPVPGGFVGTAARPRNQRESVFSSDGAVWETLIEGRVLGGLTQAAVLTPENQLILPASDDRFRPPRLDIDSLTGSRNGQVLLTAGGQLWIGPGVWRAIPLDPSRGMDLANVHPVPVEGRLLVVGVDRGRVHLAEWTG